MRNIVEVKDEGFAGVIILIQTSIPTANPIIMRVSAGPRLGSLPNTIRLTTRPYYSGTPYYTSPIAIDQARLLVVIREGALHASLSMLAGRGSRGCLP